MLPAGCAEIPHGLDKFTRAWYSGNHNSKDPRGAGDGLPVRLQPSRRLGSTPRRPAEHYRKGTCSHLENSTVVSKAPGAIPGQSGLHGEEVAGRMQRSPCRPSWAASTTVMHLLCKQAIRSSILRWSTGVSLSGQRLQLDVAKLGKAPASDAGERWFESSHLDSRE